MALSPTSSRGGGGGGASTLAQVLTAGADTGGRDIVNVPAADVDAAVTRRATAAGDGGAMANTYATGAGEGNSSAIVIAGATDGAADVSREAVSTTWQANANSTAEAGDGTAKANTSATTTGSGSAECKNIAAVGGAGTATATLQASNADETHIAVITCRATASGQSITITGLPTSDPGVAGQLYTLAQVLKVSAG